MFKLVKKAIKACLPYGLVGLFGNEYFRSKTEYFRSKSIFKNYYNSISRNYKCRTEIEYTSKKIIYMADGRILVGGLADRFRGMVSLYKIARDIGVEFKINFISPFELTDYLIPNKYDWRINQKDIIYDSGESVICTLVHNTVELDAVQKIQKLLKQYNQIHITTNMHSADSEYSALFDYLFRPSSELSKLMSINLSGLGGDFISATFRFQALLGDFYDGKCPVLPENERMALIDRCLEHLEEIHLENEGEKIFVTSDSITFLNKAKKAGFVYVVPGEIAHIDYSAGLDKDIYMKVFVDYFLLTYSKKIYLVIDGQMYNSGFSQRASLHRVQYIIKRYK